MWYSKNIQKDFFISLYTKLKTNINFFFKVYNQKFVQHNLKTKFVRLSEINLVLVNFVKSNNQFILLNKILI